MVSLVDNELFFMPSIFALASAVVEGEPSSRKPTPTAAAAPASAVPARNFRRFKYRPFGVISDEGMSADFLINIKNRPQLSVRQRVARRFAVRRPHIDMTQDGRKSFNCHVASNVSTVFLCRHVASYVSSCRQIRRSRMRLSCARPALPGLCEPAFA